MRVESVPRVLGEGRKRIKDTYINKHTRTHTHTDTRNYCLQASPQSSRELLHVVAEAHGAVLQVVGPLQQPGDDAVDEGEPLVHLLILPPVHLCR